MDYKKILLGDEYSFLRDNAKLGKNIELLALGGSHAYGTNVEDSDLDIRGMAINNVNELFNLKPDFEQVVDVGTDTTIYSLNKMIKLLLGCNPNTIEILGCKPEHYIYIGKYGQMLLDNKQNFLSKKAIQSFGGYANQQFNRLKHALIGNGQNDDLKLNMLEHSLECALSSFNANHALTKSNVSMRIICEDEYAQLIEDRLTRSRIALAKDLASDLDSVMHNDELSVQEKISRIQSLNDMYSNDLDKLEKKYSDALELMSNDVNDRIVISGEFTDYPLGDIQSLLREFHKIKTEYGNINKRNTKKDAKHMAKHMMHLIRLYMMGTDLNASMEVKTYRDGADHDLLMSIRNGDYMTGDGMQVRPEFYDVLETVQRKFNYSVKHTVLPDEPNYDVINEMLLGIYLDIINK